ncbi:MAG TPA: hypothetical protein VK994_03375, partial [Bacteroidales bacterium]|nr:hypothetical protein [Bacteroidales bacterium]
MARKERKHRIGLISLILWLINIILALALGGSYLASWVDPQIISLFAFLGLIYPTLLIANIVFFLFWLIRGKRFLFLSLLVILLGYKPMGRYIQVTHGEKAPETGFLIKMLTYNVQNMSHSN